METLATILIITVAILHGYFLILEMFLWDKPTGLRVFANTLEHAQKTKVLAANQGLYNGFLAVGLIWSWFSSLAPTTLFFLACIVVAGIYGAATASKKILYVQALPALLALIVTYLSL